MLNLKYHLNSLSGLVIFDLPKTCNMKISLFFLSLVCFLASCKKDSVDEDKFLNGINVNSAVSTFNSFRTQGISGFPGVAAVKWNDTLSNAAYNFAKAKGEDANTPSNVYFLENGQTILDFPAILNYSKFTNFALYYAFAADADVKAVITAGFATSNDQAILSGLMSPTAKQFGMGQFRGRWFLIMSN